MKLCIFPNDPLQAYFDKGEIKERYYNPNNFFDEVHIISLIDKDIEESKVKVTVGTAKLKIHSVGKINIKNKNKNLERIIELVKKINPDIIRAYNPFVEGWLAAKCAKKLNIPFYLSLHTQYDYNRKLVKKRNLKKYFVLKYTEKFIEPFVLQNANKITIVFKVIESYVKN
ncbi:glycosyltransferase, partial [bacterium]|nr:glycosyltransferase [bacterium]